MLDATDATTAYGCISELLEQAYLAVASAYECGMSYHSASMLLDQTNTVADAIRQILQLEAPDYPTEGGA